MRNLTDSLLHGFSTLVSAVQFQNLISELPFQNFGFITVVAHFLFHDFGFRTLFSEL